MLFDKRSDVFLRRQNGLLKLLLRHLLPGSEVERGFQRELAHALGLLCHCRVEYAALNSFETRHVPIEPDNQDFVAKIRHFHSLAAPSAKASARPKKT